MGQAESVVVQVPATTQVSVTGEEIITLDLDTELIPPTQDEVTPVPRRGTSTSTSRRGQKRTYDSTNTAPDYATAGPSSVSEDQYYPAHLFQNVPGQLQIDNLRKKALVSIIKSNEAVVGLVEILKGCVGPLKNALLVMSGQELPNEKNKDDHSYQVRLDGNST